MKTILTKYLPPTMYKGSRIQAFDSDKNIIVISYPYTLSGMDCHVEAVKSLIKKMNWENLDVKYSDYICISNKIYGVHILHKKEKKCV